MGYMEGALASGYRLARLFLAIIASGRNSLTFAQLLGRLQPMGEAFATVAALRSALSTR
jgi:hypothetical protein